MESARHDSNDAEAMVFGFDILAENRRISAIVLLPELLTDDSDEGSVGQAVIAVESAA